MFEIINAKNGEFISISDSLRYIKFNPNSHCFIQASKEDADGIAVNSIPYNFFNSNLIEGADSVIIQEIDSDIVFNKIIKNDKGIISLEDAVCDLDMITEDRFAQIEDALCELDMKGAG